MAGKHRIARASRPRNGLATLFGAVGLSVVGLLAGLSATGVTYAAWNSSVSIPGATIKTGTTNIALSNAAQTTPASTLSLGGLANTLGPGDKIATAFTVSNTGTTPVTVGLTGTTASDSGAGGASGAFVNALQAQFTPVTNAASCTTSISSPAPAALQGLTSSASLFHLAPQGQTGASAVVCLVLTLSSTAPSSAQGLTANFTLTLTGKQAAS